jgi:SAM-dependent methyltransferase
MNTQTTPLDYSLGVNDAERVRLLAQCEMHRSEAELLLERIGIGTGWDVLDLGCGPLGILDILAQRVGRADRIVGIDREPEYLAMVARSMSERNITRRVDLIEADGADTGLPEASFDLVHERLVLNNVPRPEKVLSEMVRLARPGGWVAVQDMDWISWTCVPEHPDWDRLAAAAEGAWSGDVHIGRRLPSLLRGAGLVDIDMDASIRIFRPGQPYHHLLLRFVQIHRDRILARGVLRASALTDSARRLQAHLEDPNTFTLYATLVQATGRKP